MTHLQETSPHPPAAAGVPPADSEHTTARALPRRAPELDARRALLALALALAVVVGGFNMGRAFFGPIKGQDLAPYYVGARLLADGHGDLMYATGVPYAIAARHYGVPPFKKGADNLLEPNVYPPSTTVLYVPLAILPFTAARIVVLVLGLAMTVAASILLVADRKRDQRRTLTVVSLLAAAAFFPVWYSLYEGQINPLIWLLVVAGLVLLRRRRPVAAGAAIGFAALIKLFPAILILYLVAKRQWRAAGAAVATAAALMAACLPVTGTAIWRMYFTDVLPHYQSSGRSNFRNQGFGGFFERLLTKNTVVASLGDHRALAGALTIVCALALVAAALWLVRRPAAVRSDRFALEYALFLIIGVLVLPKSWEHYAVLLLPAFVFAFAALFGPRQPGGLRAPLGLAAAVTVSYVTWAFLLQAGMDYQSLPRGLAASPLFSAKFLASLLLTGCLAVLIRRASARSDDEVAQERARLADADPAR